jgi:YbbR domain-containing protein
VLEYVASFLLAFALAVFIWLNATRTEDPIQTRFLEVPVSFVGLPADTVLVSGDQDTIVQLRLEGPRSVLQEVTPEDFVATVDLSQVPPGQETSVEINVVGSRPGATISFITPEQVDVLLEQQVTKRVPVEVDLRGTVARGHTQGEPLLEPGEITVSGPAGRVGQLDFAQVTMFLNNAVETTTESIPPIFYDQQGRVASVTGLQLDTNEVVVTVPVEESAGFADKLVTVVWTGEPAPGYRLLSVSADPPSVLVEGRPAQVNRLTSVRTEPIDITGLTSSFQQAAILDLPEGITTEADQNVMVNIEIEPILTTSTYNRTPDLIGLGSGLEAVVVPEQVRVVLFGPLPVLDSLVEEDVRVTLDVFGLGPGSYSIEPRVDVPDRGIEVRSIQPTAVTVTIAEPEASTGSIASASPLAATRTTRSGGSGLSPAICTLLSSGTWSLDLAKLCTGRQIAR